MCLCKYAYIASNLSIDIFPGLSTLHFFVNTALDNVIMFSSTVQFTWSSWFSLCFDNSPTLRGRVLCGIKRDLRKRGYLQRLSTSIHWQTTLEKRKIWSLLFTKCSPNEDLSWSRIFLIRNYLSYYAKNNFNFTIWTFYEKLTEHKCTYFHEL